VIKLLKAGQFDLIDLNELARRDDFTDDVYDCVIGLLKTAEATEPKLMMERVKFTMSIANGLDVGKPTPVNGPLQVVQVVSRMRNKVPYALVKAIVMDDKRLARAVQLAGSAQKLASSIAFDYALLFSEQIRLIEWIGDHYKVDLKRARYWCGE
jgi:hypothetical protein